MVLNLVRCREENLESKGGSEQWTVDYRFFMWVKRNTDIYVPCMCVCGVFRVIRSWSEGTGVTIRLVGCSAGMWGMGIKDGTA